MQFINMNSDLMHVIRTGVKSATTRLGIKTKYSLGPLRIFNAKNKYDVIEGKEIYKIESLPLCSLTDDIAELEGYSCKEELINKLVEIYGNIDEYEQMTVIYWI